METGVTEGRPPPPPDRTAEYVLDPEDFVDCAMFLWERGAHRQLRDSGRRLAGWLVVLAAVLGAAAFLWRVEELGPLACAGLAVAAALALILLGVDIYRIFFRGALHRRRVRDEVEQYRKIGVIKVGRRDRVTLGPEGFTEVNDYRDDEGGVEVVEHKETRVYWPAVERIDVADQHAIFTVTNKRFLYVPKRAFASEDAFLRFVGAAQELRRAFACGERAGVLPPPAGPAGGLRLPP